jgi:hypothetical protein
VRLGGAALVAVMQPAHLRNGNDAPQARMEGLLDRIAEIVNVRDVFRFLRGIRTFRPARATAKKLMELDMDRPGSHVTKRYRPAITGSDGIFADYSTAHSLVPPNAPRAEVKSG